MNPNAARFGADLILDPILPVPLIVLLGVVMLAVTIYVYRAVGMVMAGWRSGVLMVLRLGGIALVTALLLQPSRQEHLPPSTSEHVTYLAVDTSRSMNQCDVDNTSRLDAAKKRLLQSDLVAPNGEPVNARLRLFQFDADARPVTKSFLDLAPRGHTTRLHQSVRSLLQAAGPGEAINAVILMTDGHDFELVNPAKTAAAARARNTAIYAVPLGKQGDVRDVAVRIVGFQPYYYVKQTARISAALRLIGCEFEDLNVQLLRHGKVVESRRVNADELQELPLEFEVSEPEVGQYEYEVRVLPLREEVDTGNNSAITYVNVIDQQIRVLILEGDPYWDTTFLQRSLMRNNKFDVDTIIVYGASRVQAIRKSSAPENFRIPTTREEMTVYDVVILGRRVDRLLDEQQVHLLDEFVRVGGGAVVFSRGRAFQEGNRLSELEPVIWSEPTRERVQLRATAEGRVLSAFQLLGNSVDGMDSLPELMAGRDAGEAKSLTSTLAVVSGPRDGSPAPAVVHRRYGSGQVLSVGVAGMWRWGLHAKGGGPNTPFDRFWDQMILWLLAGRDFIPTSRYSFRPSSANIVLGEKAYFRLTMRHPEPSVTSVPVRLFLGDDEVGRTSLTASSAGAERLTAEFLPERVGRYRAVAAFPDGTTQESRFIVFTENLEETEVATDVVGLRRLCESSGGSIVESSELPRLLNELDREPTDSTPRVRMRPVWDRVWVFYLTGFIFGLDWFLRRRWGLC